ncbi:uncharacterized protein LOC135586971 isoform X2 [Musa acuminata AAA Group]|uniref:uncharacterized protein LOC135586971 isoform X2 n=1 Tax=Musa acuminata AAA Group TaxID=214697 RepID=UPI0031D4C5F9
MLRSKCPRNHPLRAIVLGIWMRQFESDAVLSQGGQELAADAIKIESFTLLLILFFGPRNRCGATWEGSPEETQSSRKERRRFLWILPTAYSTTRPRTSISKRKEEHAIMLSRKRSASEVPCDRPSDYLSDGDCQIQLDTSDYTKGNLREIQEIPASKVQELKAPTVLEESVGFSCFWITIAEICT